MVVETLSFQDKSDIQPVYGPYHAENVAALFPRATSRADVKANRLWRIMKKKRLYTMLILIFIGIFMLGAFQIYRQLKE